MFMVVMKMKIQMKLMIAMSSKKMGLKVTKKL
jgi:hypothetical protein